MNGPHRESSSTGLGANGEDLNVVLGRFQNWAATRSPRATEEPGAKSRTATSKTERLLRDAREVSYEQALRASRYRRPGTAAPLDPVANAVAESTDEPGSASDDRICSTDLPNQAEEPVVRPWDRRWPEVNFAKPVPAAVASHAHAKTASASPGRPVAATETKMASLSNESPVSVVARSTANTATKARSIKRAAQDAPVAKPARAAASAAATAKTETIRPALPSRRRDSQPAFRDVLKGTAALASSGGPSSLTTAKSTTLTLRVSDSEQARILACAAQANLSVSAYLRQCAIGVDELRDQVQIALAKLRKEQERIIPPPGLAAVPGILGRSAMNWLRRFRGGHSEYTAVSIR
jgi:hypothetical protein